MENKNFNWRPMSEYTGGRVLATNGLDVLIGEINSEGDCESEEDSGTILCGITGFIKIEEILPELKESEDEKIINNIKKVIGWYRGMFTEKSLMPEQYQEIDAWLEKQGEQSDANKEYWRGYREGKQEVLDKYAELEKQGEQKPYGQRKECTDCQFNYAGECKGYCAMKRSEQKPADKINPKFHEGDIIKPKDGGHEPWQIMQVDMFDKKYRFKDGYVIHFSQEDNYELVEQKPAWSEEDEMIALSIEQVMNCASLLNIAPEKIDKIRTWLKFLKDRMRPQPKQEWSEEKEKDFFNAAKHLREYAERCVQGEYSKIEIFSLADRIESLCPQSQWKPVDKNVYVVNGIVLAQKKDKSDLFKGYVLCKDHTLTPDEYERYINISDINSQSHWKPSDEQMEALEYYMHTLVCNEHKEILFGLYTDLKKLRGEQS